MGIYIGIGFVIVGIVLIIFLFKKDKKNKPQKEEITQIDVEKNEKYMFLKELSIYEYVASILPKNYIVFPKVSAGLLVNPSGTKHAYNEIKSKVVDLVVFTRETMSPVLIIDCYDTTYSNGMLEELEPLLLEVLKKASLEVLSIQVKHQLNKDEIKEKILAKLEENKKI